MATRVVKILALWTVASALASAQTPDPDDFFESRVRPVLANNCYSCHTQSKLGDLRLDTRDSVLAGGKSGPAIVPGKPEESLLIQAVNHTHPRLKMPMAGAKLKDAEIADLEAWVKMGAPWSAAATARKDTFVITDAQRAFWSFQPIREPAGEQKANLPSAKANRINTVDRFILATLKKRGLKPVAAADRRTLIRRVTFDLIGLPPTPEEVDAFLGDASPDAFAKVVDRLLASPHYGERWARYWLDIARYGEDDVRGSSDPPKPAYPNAWRYRDWVIDAFNRDLPYNLFVKAQIAADLMETPDREKLLPALGFLGLGPWLYDTAESLQARANERDERVDALTRGVLGITVACARCHDHKYDPISSRDYYALAGVFASTEYNEVPLGPTAEYKNHQKKIKQLEAAVKEFVQAQNDQLGEILAHKTARYMMAAWRARRSLPQPDSLDPQTLERWVKYLEKPQRDHAYLKAWDELVARGSDESEARKVAGEFQHLLLTVLAEKKAMDEENRILVPKKKEDERLFPNQFSKPEDYCENCAVDVKALERDKFVLWRELFAPRRRLADLSWSDDGVLYYPDDKIDRFLSPDWKNHLDAMREELKALEKNGPPPYPYLHTITDLKNPANQRLNVRGSPYNLGEETPRRFVEVLSAGEPPVFRKGSGRLELAEAVVNHPLAARVMANRVWKHHFGRGIVGTPSNFGQLGERPTHPELLEHLASRLVESGWSIKALHREILLSATYQLGADYSPKNFAADPDNRYYWRAGRRRLDLEAIRDSLLAVAGTLDGAVGGASAPLADDNRRRTIYGKVSRTRVHELLSLFDFPDPHSTSEQRTVTNVATQRLFFMNSEFAARQAEALAKRLQASGDDTARIRQAYRLLYAREATDAEVRLGLDFLRSGAGAWPQYAQALLSANEFLFVN